jgi:putative transposase
MKRYHDEFPVKVMAKVLDVSSGGYYAWLKRTTSPRQQKRTTFDAKVVALFVEKRRRYGRRRLRHELIQRGERCTEKRVRASMCRNGLQAIRTKRFVCTTDSGHTEPVAQNLLQRKFTVFEPNRVWVSDITYLPSRSGWLYLVTIIDLFSRMVVGWHLSDSLKHETVLAAYQRARNHRRPEAGLLFHSDRGIQYCCSGFRKTMERHGVIQSMSRKGNCWDNAVAESFFASLKRELMGDKVFENQQEAKLWLFEYIEVHYNRHRLHSSLGYSTPVEHESRYWCTVYERSRVA